MNKKDERRENAKKILKKWEHEAGQSLQKSLSWLQSRQSIFTASIDSHLLPRTPEIVEMYNNQTPAEAHLKPDSKKSLSANPKTFKSICLDKCKPVVENGFDADSPMEFGNKHEFVAKFYISRLFGLKVYDQTLLKNIRYPDKIGASPDGAMLIGSDTDLICKPYDNGDSIVLKDHFRIIEIKCPVARPTKNYAIPDYFCQMQQQMYATGCMKCYFVDCAIKLISKEDFMKYRNKYNSERLLGPMPINKTGIIFEDMSCIGKYVYPKLSKKEMTPDDYLNWMSDMLIENPFLVPSYHIITEVNISLYRADPEWEARTMEHRLTKHETLSRLLSNEGKEELEKLSVKNVISRKKKFNKIKIDLF